MKYKLKVFSFLSLLLLTACSSDILAEEKALISVTMSRSGKVSYISISPLYYEASRKDQFPIQVSPGDTFENKKPWELRPMELIIYSTCDRVDPQKGSVLDLRPQFLHSSLLLSPHPKDLPAAYYLFPIGLFRMLKQFIIRAGDPYFEEKGTIKLFNSQNTTWPVNISREYITATNPKTDYSIEFSNVANQPLFIQALKSAAVLMGKIPQVTVLLESQSLYVKATYALVHKGAKDYQAVKAINIIEWWSKQQKWCPRK